MSEVTFYGMIGLGAIVVLVLILWPQRKKAPRPPDYMGGPTEL